MLKRLLENHFGKKKELIVQGKYRAYFKFDTEEDEFEKQFNDMMCEFENSKKIRYKQRCWS